MRTTSPLALLTLLVSTLGLMASACGPDVSDASTTTETSALSAVSVSADCARTDYTVGCPDCEEVDGAVGCADCDDFVN